jgi:predicted patatin/cPLA2 family phospholipase
MKTTLEELYFGNIVPAEQSFERDDQYNHAAKVIEEHEQKLMEENYKEYTALYNARAEITLREISTAFANGFKLGIKIILEVFK